jgi:hypothetical protein
LQTTTIIYIIIALLASSAVSWFLYFYKQKERRKIDYLLFGLRAISVFLLLLLLINPAVERKEITNEKPILSVLVDNSLSIKHFQRENVVSTIVDDIKTNTSISDKFNVQFYQFGNSLEILDTLPFSENQTNIYKAISGVEAIHKNEISPVVLISDGNQTNGNLYPYISTKKNVFPIVIGDTVTQTDLRITQLNVNKYSYLKNKFPVEITVLYDGDKGVSSQLVIDYKGKPIYRKNLIFNSDKNVQTIATTINSTKEGVQYYRAYVKLIDGEKNVENNAKSFSVEVLNEQTKILLLTSVLHPDIGAFKKAIETNKQRSVTIRKIKDLKENIAEYQLVMLYQPTVEFQSIFEKIQKEKSNYFVITGATTNWNFLNEMQPNYYKKSIKQTEAYGANFNRGFLTFGQKDISFESFSPLKDAFGKITMKTKFDALLHQSISGIATQTPLLATFENENQKSAVLFGEGIWKWRASSFINTNSFQDFDAFLGNLLQYIASTKKRDRLSLNYEKLFTANSPIVVSAFYVDKNYQFDSRAILNVSLRNTDTNVKQNIPFSLQNNSFEAVIENLPSGNYQFDVGVENQSIKRSGQFKITKYQIEEQFTKANQEAMRLLANNTKGKLYYETNANELMKDLIFDERYNIIQKSKTIQQYLIEWKFLLFLAIFFFSVEWFIRKYIGKI